VVVVIVAGKCGEDVLHFRLERTVLQFLSRAGRAGEKKITPSTREESESNLGDNTDPPRCAALFYNYQHR